MKTWRTDWRKKIYVVNKYVMVETCRKLPRNSVAAMKIYYTNSIRCMKNMGMTGAFAICKNMGMTGAFAI